MDLLNQLPLAQRSVLLLHFIEDFSLEEIARITAMPLGTVKSRLHYARRSLRKLLEEKQRKRRVKLCWNGIKPPNLNSTLFDATSSAPG